ncbi:MAG: nucleotidyltransferase family protein [Gammaproteobacteria bacterium]|nr:nucleotidyltransferase family protein [Gammaproteobacteria bacterium]
MHNWRNVLIGSEEPISRAIEILDKEAQRIVLVINNKNQLLGTVTDGDIRRGLINRLGMDEPVREIMYKAPRTASVDDDRETILEIMTASDLLHVPLLDKDGCLVGMETIQHLTSKACHDNPVFLMAGGFGKRLRPLTLDTPKPLLKVGNTPILQTILESFIKSGFHNFYISTHYKADMVRDHFGNGDNWGVKIEYVHENEPLGTAGALGLLPDDLSDKPLIMMNGDLLTKVNFEDLLVYHERFGGIATMCVREYDFQVPYGVVTADEYRVIDIVEKPIHKFFVNAGIYVINPELYSDVSGSKFLDMPDLLQNQITRSKQVNMFPVHEYWLDIGRTEDFELAQITISKGQV